jgi:hypothetical protein
MAETIPELRSRLVTITVRVKQMLREGAPLAPSTVQELLCATEDMTLAFERMVTAPTFDIAQARSLDKLIESAVRLSERVQKAEWADFNRSKLRVARAGSR